MSFTCLRDLLEMLTTLFHIPREMSKPGIHSGRCRSPAYGMGERTDRSRGSLLGRRAILPGQKFSLEGRLCYWPGFEGWRLPSMQRVRLCAVIPGRKSIKLHCDAGNDDRSMLSFPERAAERKTKHLLSLEVGMHEIRT